MDTMKTKAKTPASTKDHESRARAGLSTMLVTRKVKARINPKKLAMATSTLTNKVRYESLSKRVNWSLCPALESTSMIRSSSFEESATAIAVISKKYS
jgi:hypothetical protein